MHLICASLSINQQRGTEFLVNFSRVLSLSSGKHNEPIDDSFPLLDSSEVL
ncbi:hypothetical protein PspLS_03180 [Pyricularia sp. CBS 133598]|nr:hypothetical protein PspLS_03180 [Pyricularia sp. CBS 133598]